MTNRKTWAVLAAFVAFVVGSTVCVWNWPRISTALELQSEQANVTLFRMGEVLSIRAELAERFRATPKVDYRAEDSIRILKIAFDDAAQLDRSRDQARRIALAALKATKKGSQIDRVEIRVADTLFSFSIAELHATPTDRNDGAIPMAWRSAV